MKASVYNDKLGNQITLFADHKYTKKEKEYLIDPNPFNDFFIPFQNFTPKVGEPFYAAKMKVNGGYCGWNWNFGTVPTVELITILENGETKKYSVKLIVEHRGDIDPHLEEYVRLDEFHIIWAEAKIVPDDNFVCNCGHCNRNPIDKFPWEEEGNVYILGSSLERLENNISIFMKDFGWNEVKNYIDQYFVSRKKKLDQILAKYGEHYAK